MGKLNKKEPIYDVIIIGAGPAGLSAGFWLTKSGKSILIVDKGSSLDERDDTKELEVSSGIGGAGLYSDGKLSFYPSATNLWKIEPKDRLEEAYNNVADLLSSKDVDIKNWGPKLESRYTFNYNEKENSNRKWYKSIYVSQETRENLINTMLGYIGNENILIKSEVLNVIKVDGLYFVTLNNRQIPYVSKNVIYAAGRYGATDFTKVFGFIERTHFLRYEIGVRVECDSSKFKPYNDEQTDYKYIETINNGLEVRSFCCCRDGKVVKSKYKNIVSFNGSGDVNYSTRSNIGINIRLTDNKADPLLSIEAQEIINGSKKDFVFPLVEFMDEDKQFLGDRIDSLLRGTIKEVLGPKHDSHSLVYGPTIEGVGHYPIMDEDRLKINNEGIWLPGDCGGLFRGLLAAFVSGAYVALDIIQEINKQDPDLYNKLNIKASSTNDMTAIFTAQSKAFFYCRDAICEFVLKKGLLPINPFRVFDYFLNDRVDRDLIRRGNNQLIKRCDELWVFGPISDGVLFEIAYAKELKMPIKFFNVSTISEEIYPLKIDDIVFESEVHAKQVKRSDLIKFLEGKRTDHQKYEQMQFFLGEFL